MRTVDKIFPSLAVDGVPIRIEGEVNRDYVRLIEPDTRESPQAGTAEDLATLVAGQLVDQYRLSSPSS